VSEATTQTEYEAESNAIDITFPNKISGKNKFYPQKSFVTITHGPYKVEYQSNV